MEKSGSAFSNAVTRSKRLVTVAWSDVSDDWRALIEVWTDARSVWRESIDPSAVANRASIGNNDVSIRDCVALSDMAKVRGGEINSKTNSRVKINFFILLIILVIVCIKCKFSIL
jgi:hypothetical protein